LRLCQILFYKQHIKKYGSLTQRNAFGKYSTDSCIGKRKNAGTSRDIERERQKRKREIQRCRKREAESARREREREREREP
jgi:hypothetical protein